MEMEFSKTVIDTSPEQWVTYAQFMVRWQLLQWELRRPVANALRTIRVPRRVTECSRNAKKSADATVSASNSLNTALHRPTDKRAVVDANKLRSTQYDG